MGIEIVEVLERGGRWSSLVPEQTLTDEGDRCICSGSGRAPRKSARGRATEVAHPADVRWTPQQPRTGRGPRDLPQALADQGRALPDLRKPTLRGLLQLGGR